MHSHTLTNAYTGTKMQLVQDVCQYVTKQKHSVVLPELVRSDEPLKSDEETDINEDLDW